MFGAAAEMGASRGGVRGVRHALSPRPEAAVCVCLPLLAATHLTPLHALSCAAAGILT
jgi:hypothetical protein|eukprot:SAG25_NODE_47_length_18954_cov_11.266295_16_plen_58_part_00